PEKYRLPIVLCDLECLPIKIATQQLGWPQGTLAGRLARARKLLAKRLTGRGVVLSGAALAMLFPQTLVSASLATAVLETAMAFSTGKTAAAGLISANVAVLM